MSQNYEDVVVVPSTSSSLQTNELVRTPRAAPPGAPVTSSVGALSATPPPPIPGRLADFSITDPQLKDVRTEEDVNNRVQVLCRFRRPLGVDGLNSVITGQGNGGELGHVGGGWLHFDEPWEESSNVGGGVGGSGGMALESVSVRVGYDWSRRAFDRVFKPSVTQAEIYDAVEHVTHGVAHGFNGTIFAYGQTGSGKTYTMSGAENTLVWSPAEDATPVDYMTETADSSQSAAATESIVLPEGAGVIPRAVSTVLSDAQTHKEQGWDFILTATYVEIYNEKIRDLLNPAGDNLKVSEHPARGVEAIGATEVRVSTLEEAMDVLRHGAENRVTAATLMNHVSSRSHTIFTLRLDQRNVVRDCMVSGRLTLVDLAGSERTGKTRAEGRRLEEANSINVSLHTLGRVIRALSESTSHVPFRDSKLTRMLQESLGGNSRTALILCCSPEELQAQETVSTLKFGECAKRVSTFASANVVAAPSEVAAQLSELRAEVVRLKRQLQICHLRETRRYEASPRVVREPRRSRRSHTAMRGEYPLPNGIISPNGLASVDEPHGAPTGVMGSAGCAPGGNGSLPGRWNGESPMTRNVAFNASFATGDAELSSGDEYWAGSAPHDWERDEVNGWDGTMDESSPSNMTGWVRKVDSSSPLVESPPASPGGTLESKNVNSGRGRRYRKGGWRHTTTAAHTGSNGQQASVKPRGYAQEEKCTDDLGAHTVIREANALDDDQCRTPSTWRTGSSGDTPIENTRAPWNNRHQDGSQEGSVEGSQRGSWDDSSTAPREEGVDRRHMCRRNVVEKRQRTAVRPSAEATEFMELEEVDDGGDGMIATKAASTQPAEAEELLRMAFARIENLENRWKDRVSKYEKLLKLKDLRIESLMSIYQSSSLSFRQAVETKMVTVTEASP